VRLAFTVILPWLIWGVTLLACGLIILLPKAAPSEHHEYQTTVRQSTLDMGEVNSEDYLILNPKSFILTTRTPRDGSYHYQIMYADIASTYGSSGQLKVKKVHLSHPQDADQENTNSDAIAQLQYISMPEGMLNYEVLTKRMQDAFCLYIYQLNRLRCFGK